MSGRGPEVVDVEVVRDRTAEGRPDEDFLRVRRSVLRNVRADGTRGPEYPCDVVSRRRPDAVAVALHGRGPDGRVWVVLREGIRPAVLLRRSRPLAHPDPAPRLRLLEVVAGLLEDEDAGEGGIERRAAIECREEAGYEVEPARVVPLGSPLFPSPGVTDEMVHFRSAAVDLAARGEATGDGSEMEASGRVVLVALADALARCRDGGIPDMKTEVALRRLAETLG